MEVLAGFTAKRSFRGVEHAAHSLRIAHIGFGGRRPPAACHA
jgi:hypothetical protein